jgi:hypothetical protein
LTFPQVPDLAPYVASDAYGIVSSPTVVVIDERGNVADAVESWTRDGDEPCIGDAGEAPRRRAGGPVDARRWAP